MSKKQGLEQLKRDFPIFTVKNKTSVARNIPLANNEEVACQPAPALTKIASADLMQIPEFSYFTMVEPDMKTIAKYGLLKRPNTETAAEPVAETEEDPSLEAGETSENTVQ